MCLDQCLCTHTRIYIHTVYVCVCVHIYVFIFHMYMFLYCILRFLLFIQDNTFPFALVLLFYALSFCLPATFVDKPLKKKIPV